MFTFIRSLPVQRLLTEQLPALAISLVISELFYKFHSFVLETAAFLITWFVLDALIQFIVRMLEKLTGRNSQVKNAKNEQSS